MVDRKANGADKASVDVLVAGAGYVGLAAAVSLKQARPSLGVAIAQELCLLGFLRQVKLFDVLV